MKENRCTVSSRYASPASVGGNNATAADRRRKWSCETRSLWEVRLLIAVASVNESGLSRSVVSRKIVWCTRKGPTRSVAVVVSLLAVRNPAVRRASLPGVRTAESNNGLAHEALAEEGACGFDHGAVVFAGTALPT